MIRMQCRTSPYKSTKRRSSTILLIDLLFLNILEQPTRFHSRCRCKAVRTYRPNNWNYGPAILYKLGHSDEFISWWMLSYGTRSLKMSRNAIAFLETEQRNIVPTQSIKHIQFNWITCAFDWRAFLYTHTHSHTHTHQIALNFSNIKATC